MEIERLEEAVFKDKRNLNNIVTIKQFLDDKDPSVVFEAMQSLRTIFCEFVVQKKEATDAERIVETWIIEQYRDFGERLFGLLTHEEPGLQIPAIKTLIEFCKVELALNNAGGKYAEQLSSMFHILLSNDLSQFVVDVLLEYITEYSDLRYYFLLSGKSCFAKPNQHTLSKLMKNGYVILSAFDGVFEDDQDFSSAYLDIEGTPMFKTAKGQKKAFSDCWIAYLRMPLTVAYFKSVLAIIDKKVMPYLTKPELLMDFFTDSYNAGGIVSLLALNGLFKLIVSHNLDYPDFYKKFYALLIPSLPHINQHRTQFFRLANLFLSSSHLPAYLVAAYIKRMARLTLTCPPATTTIIVPFIYNLLKRHPECMVLIHRTGNQSDDPYDSETDDFSACNAIKSSLWELEALKQHYLPNISDFALIFAEKFDRQAYPLDDFYGQSYSSLFETEMSKKLKDAHTFESEAMNAPWFSL